VHFIYNKNLKPFAHKLRIAMTEEENKLWYKFLQPLPVKVYRQRPIGKYIVDFYCPEACVVIEVDGSQHYDEENIKQDNIRDTFLNSIGLTVLRYTNFDINTKFSNVCEDLYNHLVEHK
jgi:very-short-patch-repair endonuclease